MSGASGPLESIGVSESAGATESVGASESAGASGQITVRPAGATEPAGSLSDEHPAGGRDIFLVINSVDELGGVTSWTHRMAWLFTERGHRVHVIGIAPALPSRGTALGQLPYRTTTLYDAHPRRPPRGGLRARFNPAERRHRAARAADMRAHGQRLGELFRAATRPGGVVIVGQVWAMEWVALAEPAVAGLTVIGMSHESYQATRASSRFRRVLTHYADADRLLLLTGEDADLWAGEGLTNVGCMPNPLPFLPKTPSPLTEQAVACIGRLSDEKGIDLLLEAWAAVAPRHPGWELRIYGAGEPDDEEALRQQCDALGLTDSVAWMGLTGDVPAALRGASVFALPSRAEGLPLSMMEAMAAGVPCAAFDCAPGVREIVRDGENGLLAAPGNTRELACRLDALMSDAPLRDRLGREARVGMRRYSSDEVARRWEELFAFLER